MLIERFLTRGFVARRPPHAAYRLARRIVVSIVGALLLIIGVVMIVLPGSALLVIPLGLATLGLEFAWARRLLRRLRMRLGFSSTRPVPRQ